MEDQVPAEVSAERFNRLLELQKRISTEENQKLVGTSVEVLVAAGEGRKDGTTERVSGRAADNRLVHVALPANLATPPRPGDMIKCEVTHGAPSYLLADSGVKGGKFEIRRTNAGDAWEKAELRKAELIAEASGKLPVNLGIPTIMKRPGM